MSSLFKSLIQTLQKSRVKVCISYIAYRYNILFHNLACSEFSIDIIYCVTPIIQFVKLYLFSTNTFKQTRFQAVVFMPSKIKLNFFLFKLCQHIISITTQR